MAVDIDEVVYKVPDGVDPAVLQAALKIAGFPSKVEQHWGDEFLHVPCPSHERERVRALITDVQRRDYVPELHLAAVRFRGED